MDFRDSAEGAAFRQEVRDVLAIEPFFRRTCT